MKDEKYMSLALELARQGMGRTSPNPMVGAVIVKNGEVIGKGFHRRCGELHAERNALADCKVSPEGATIYVTLEPCCHHGRTPPCTDAVIAGKISRVVVGSPDPNPLVDGGGVAVLRKAGIEVTEGVMRDECDKLNEVFLHYIRRKTPYVIMKYAMTADGCIASATGASKWITGEEARQSVQRDRGHYSSIMVGVNTVIADDPLLTCRIEGGRNPLRIICDTKLRMPLESKIAATAKEIPTVIACGVSDSERTKPYKDLGFEIMTLPLKDDRVDLCALVAALGRREIDSLYIEGGSTLNASALQAGIVDKIKCCIAPKLMGGDGLRPIAPLGITDPDSAVMLSSPTVQCFDGDILLEYEVKRCSRE